MTSERCEFAVCLASEGYDDLESWKVYRIVRDRKAATLGCLRVIDESGEDYLYPANRFITVTFPAAVRRRLLATVGRKKPNAEARGVRAVERSAPTR